MKFIYTYLLEMYEIYDFDFLSKNIQKQRVF